MSVTIVTRTTKSKRSNPSADIRLSVRVRTSGFDAICCTGISVPYSSWDANKEQIKDCSSTNQELMKRLSYASSYLPRLKAYIEAQFDKGAITSSEILGNYVRAFADKQRPIANVPQEPIELLKYKIARMEDGTHRCNGRRFEQGTINQWKSFVPLVVRFHKQCRAIDFEEIDGVFWDTLKNYLEDVEGHMPSSINKTLAKFRAYFVYAKSCGLPLNDKALITYKKIPVRPDERKAKTYLNEAELQALYNMPLTGLKEQVRDIFMLGCYLGQRVSDYNYLTRGDFRLSSSGRFQVVAFTQEKTDNAVVVPILYDNVYKIAEKYDYKFPRISEVIINRYIKDIVQELSASVPSLATNMRTALDNKEQKLEAQGKVEYVRDEKGYVIKPRYELITTHTARRSCITNLYLKNIFTTAQLMSISGHKSESAFYEYICCSSDEIADRIAEIAENAKKHRSDMS